MKLTKNELRTIIKEELADLFEAKTASMELSKLISGLKIKDKALDQLIRRLVFNNTDAEVKRAMEKFIPLHTSLNLEHLNEEEYMGHYKIKGKDIFVDTNFVNKSKGVLDGRLKHMGFGEFYLSTSQGDVQFIRTSEKISGFVGRAHRLSDNKDGKLADKLVKQMVKDGKAEKV